MGRKGMNYEQMKNLYYISVTISIGIIMLIMSSCTKTEYIERTDTLVVSNTEIVRDTIWNVKVVNRSDTVRETNTIIITKDKEGNITDRDATHEIYISKSENDSTAFYRSQLKELSDSLMRMRNSVTKEEVKDKLSDFTICMIWLSYLLLIITAYIICKCVFHK